MAHLHRKANVNTYFIVIYILAFIMVGILFLYNFYLGVIFSLIYFVIAFFNYRTIKLFNKQRQQHFQEVSIQINNASKKAYLEMPLGIIIYNSNYFIEWANPYLSNIYETSFTGKALQ